MPQTSTELQQKAAGYMLAAANAAKREKEKEKSKPKSDPKNKKKK